MNWTPPDFDPEREIRDQTSSDEWRRAIDAIASRHGLDTNEAAPFASGSDVVWGTPTHVIKLSAPEWAWQIEAEARHLAFVEGKLSVSTPAYVAHGEIGGWPYIVMARISGQPIANVWSDIPKCGRLALAERLGALTRELHDLDCTELPETWPDFWARCTADVPARHAEPGVPEARIDEIAPFLEEVGPVPTTPHVFLHTELLDQHVFVEERDGRFEPCGLIDFADGRVGPAEYDFPAIAEFIFRGEPGLMRRFLFGYGYPVEALTLALSERLMAWSLCHRYGRLSRITSALAADRDTSLQALAERLYDLSDRS